MLHFASYIQGLGLMGGLIVAIGAQNAYVLSQGIRGNYCLSVALFCLAADMLLCAVGVSGVGAALALNPALREAAGWGGAAFLILYGLRSLRSAMRGGSLDAEAEAGACTRKTVLLTLVAVTFLNPHFYLDTVVLLGSVSSRLASGERLSFYLGGVTASAVWFFGITFGGRFLAPLFRRRSSWRILDGVVALTMWTIAASLLRELAV